MRLLFLDMDGVLNSKRTAETLGKKQDVSTLDPIALALVRKVCRDTGCMVCLSSDWRMKWGAEDLGKALHLPITMATPVYSDGVRGEEIQAVLNDIEPDKWVILDDITLPEHTPLDSQMDKLVKVNGNDGVSYKNYKDLMNILV